MSSNHLTNETQKLAYLLLGLNKLILLLLVLYLGFQNMLKHT